MPQLLAPHQSLLGSFPDASAAEAGMNALQQAGFDPEKLSIMSQSLEPNPPVLHTEAVRGAGGGALAGTVFGGLAGLLLGYMTAISPSLPQVGSAQVLIGMVLAGAGIGAAGGSLLGVISGARIPKSAETSEQKDRLGNYIIVAEQVTPEAVVQAKDLLKQFGSLDI
jgi:hypothetical protein